MLLKDNETVSVSSPDYIITTVSAVRLVWWWIGFTTGSVLTALALLRIA